VTEIPEFDPVKWRDEVRGYLDYLSAAWVLAVELAEKSITRREDTAGDDDMRRSLVFELALRIFDKMSLDVRDVARASPQPFGGGKSG